MAALTEPQKVFVVQQLAMWKTPSEVADAVKEEFGVEIDRQQVHYYSPERAGGQQLPKKWRTLFDDTRKAFREATAEIGIANPVVRLQRLETLYHQVLRGRGNVPLATAILKQAAEETGGKYTNHHVLEHSGKVETTTGIMPVPVASMGEWMQIAMQQQEALEHDANDATARALPGAND